MNTIVHPRDRRSGVAAPPSGFGSFHQQYRIDGKLVAVGVVDVLPFCLSSKYFFWDPDYAALSLGKLGTLREIEWVREASRHCPTLRYYYMGYYIHDCPKMRYKGEYKPSYLRCGSTGKWCALDQVRESVLDRGTGFAPFAAAVERTTDPASAVERDDKDAVGCNLGLIRGNRLGEAVPGIFFPGSGAATARDQVEAEGEGGKMGEGGGEREGVHDLPPVTGSAHERRRRRRRRR